MSPIEDGSDTVKIVQDAYFSLLSLDAGNAQTYKLNKTGNGIYVFVLEGSLKVGDELLQRRDGMGITEENELEISATNHAEVLFMEVPMK